MANKYLDEIGYKEYIPEKDDKRWSKFNREIDERGFPSYEVWDLSETFIAWMYSHLAAYLEDADEFINLNYHKFEFNGESYTERESIEFIMDKYKKYLLLGSHEMDINKERIIVNGVKEATKLLAEILPVLWW